MTSSTSATQPGFFDVRMSGFRDRTEVAEVLRLLDARVRMLQAEAVAVPEASRRVLAEDVQAEVAVPGFDRAAMSELFRLFRESRDRTADGVDLASAPIGFEANRRNLEVAIEVARAQGLLARPLAVEDLVTDALAALK